LHRRRELLHEFQYLLNLGGALGRFDVANPTHAPGATIGSLVTGVSCVARASCIAAGYYFTNPGSSTLVERFSP
jgi:hypothetical protein